MESPESDKVTKGPNSTDSVPVQDSPIFSYISKLSPIKPSKAPVAHGIPGLNSPPLVFTSPRINLQCQSGFLKRPQCPRLSSAELPQQDVNNDNTINKAICESEKPNTQLYSGLNPCTDKEHGNKGSEHNTGGSLSRCFNEYFTDNLVVDSHDSGHLANFSLKQSDNIPTSSKKAVAYNRVDISKDVTMAVGAFPDMLEQGIEDCRAKFSSSRNPVETDGRKGGGDMPISSAVDHAFDEQQNEHSETDNEGAGHKVEWNSTSQLSQESMQLAQEYKDCGETNGVVSSEQNMMLYDSKASQRECGMRRRLQFEEAQQNNMANSPGYCNQSNTVSTSKSPTSPVDSGDLESSCADIVPTPSTRQLENWKRPILSTFPTQNYGNSSLTVSKPSRIGLHLNSIVNAMPMQCSSASITSAEGGYINIRGRKSFCITSCHVTGNARSSSTSSNVVENLSVISEENQYRSDVSTIASSRNPSLQRLKPLYNPVQSKNPIEHHTIPGDKREPITEHSDHVTAFTRSSPRKKRKKTLSSNHGDGCKQCNCKKSKCLKLYCDCFAAGIYCADPCSCQGCFNRPEYEDTVLETRQQIESRNPLAFAPKVVQRVTELVAESTRENINHSTPSSARHKRGCNCKKSMCLKKYCECYQLNVGCSDGCRCEGCKNVFGRKEEYVFSKDDISKEATNERSEISFDEKLEKVASRNDFVQAELCCPHNLTPLTPLFQCSDHGKDALKSWSPERYLPSQQSDLTFFGPHGKPSGSPINSDNQDSIQETSKYILDVISFDQELCHGNSERVDDFSSHGLGNTDPLSAQQNSSLVMAMTSLMSPKTRDWTSPQFCPGSGPFSSVSSLRWRSSPITMTDLSGETKLPQVIDLDNELYNKIEDEDTPEILKDNPTPITAVKSSSPNKKRVSPPHSHLHELGSSSSKGLRSGRKFILKSVPSFPPLTPCIDVKGTTSQLTNDHPDGSNN